MKFANLYIVNNISLPVHASFQEAFSVARGIFRKIGIFPTMDELFIYRRSIDARKKHDIRFVYSVGTASEIDKSPWDIQKHGISKVDCAPPAFIKKSKSLNQPIVVVGSGPAGLFAALSLAESGYPVTLIEKGGTISERKEAVEKFKTTRELDTSTNIQFGAGGAGTFSDGKLVTRINDPLSSYVIEELIKYGAPDEIKYIAKPHIGTDILCDIIDRIIVRLKDLGVNVLFHTEMTEIVESANTVSAIMTNRGEIPCSALVVAVGHSARDTHTLMMRHDMCVEAKDFSVGMRIEHPKSVIDHGLYGDMADDPVLPAGEYNLSYNTKVRGVYTFCMCPGGVVVPAASEVGGVVVNGMSYNARNGENSNSAVCCSVFKSDYGATPMAAIEFQRNIEKLAFAAGGSDYSAPIVTLGDFLEHKCVTMPSVVTPSYMDGTGVRIAVPETYLPEFVTNSIRDAIRSFDTKISGFAMKEAVLTGPETRTSSPIRVVRDSATRLALGFNNLYPAGEGAGYAGGITSAAIDGIKTAIAVMKNINLV